MPARKVNKDKTKRRNAQGYDMNNTTYGPPSNKKVPFTVKIRGAEAPAMVSTQNATMESTATSRKPAKKKPGVKSITIKPKSPAKRRTTRNTPTPV